MKTIKIFLMLLTGLCLLFSCSEIEVVTPQETWSDVEEIDWVNLLSQVDPESEIILVTNTESIQKAIDAASDEAVIYIEPGNYNESLRLNKPGVKLVNAGLAPYEKVITQNPEEVAITSSYVPQQKRGQSNFTFNHEDLGNGIAHYTFGIPMGPGEYDLVRLHRIVKNHKRHGKKGNVFMVHGGIQDFVDVFLKYGAEKINEETSAPYYLATRGVDVWGIDLAWNLVPLEETDFGFMQEWGVEKDMHHVLKAMQIARLIRGFSKHGFNKMNLLGFSNGVSVIYGAAGYETQLHPLLRSIKGLIPIDTHFKYKPGSDIDNSTCAQADAVLEKINSGQHQNLDAFAFIHFSNLALSAPDEPSEAIAGLTNMQALMAITSTHNGYHFHGGTPFELFYTDNMRLARVGIDLGPYMPNKVMYEHFACGCSSKEVNFDNYLGDIKVPVYFITAEGGEGAYEDYTRTLIKSHDYSSYNVDDPERDTEVDFGHGDLWASFLASDWVWEPLAQWLMEH